MDAAFFSVTDAVNDQCAARSIEDAVAVNILGNSHASRELVEECLSKDISKSLSERVVQTQCLLAEECLLEDLLAQCSVAMTAGEKTRMVEAAAVDLIRQQLPSFIGSSSDLVNKFSE